MNGCTQQTILSYSTERFPQPPEGFPFTFLPEASLEQKGRNVTCQKGKLPPHCRPRPAGAPQMPPEMGCRVLSCFNPSVKPYLGLAHNKNLRSFNSLSWEKTRVRSNIPGKSQHKPALPACTPKTFCKQLSALSSLRATWSIVPGQDLLPYNPKPLTPFQIKNVNDQPPVSTAWQTHLSQSLVLPGTSWSGIDVSCSISGFIPCTSSNQAVSHEG